MTERRSIAQSTVSVMGVDLIVHQLNTGERVVEAASVERLFEVLGGPETLTEEEARTIMGAVYPEDWGRSS